ncbi:MAG: 30S ribosome-binding factor RbfA [Bacilli bacterium]
MASMKGERAGSEIQRELSMILLEDARDEDFKRVTITACDVSNDLSFAKVYFTTFDDREKVEKDLNNASGFFRSLLADRLVMRHIPELKFIFDESIEYGQNIERIIKEINEKNC